MSTRAIVLAVWLLKRLARHRPVWAVLLAVPLVVALARSIFTESALLQSAVWSCPFICALLTSAVAYAQGSADTVSGLDAALASTPIAPNGVLTARVIAGAAIFALQMVVLFAILALRF